MLKKQITVATIISSALVLGVITGCSGSRSSDASNPEASGANVSQTNPSQTNSSNTNRSARAQRREEIRKQIEAVLTPDQVKQLQEKMQQGERMRTALSSLNLSTEQKTKIQEILKSAYSSRQERSENNSQ